MKKEISSVKTAKKISEKLPCVLLISSHRVTAFPSRSLSLRLFLWNFQSNIGKPNVGHGEKGNIFIYSGKKLSGKLLCVLLIHLTELQLPPQVAFR